MLKGTTERSRRQPHACAIYLAHERLGLITRKRARRTQGWRKVGKLKRGLTLAGAGEAEKKGNSGDGLDANIGLESQVGKRVVVLP